MDAKSFKQHILPLQPVMQRMAEAILRDTMLAEDAVQDAVVALWRQRSRLDKVLNLEAYCITLVKRRCIDLLRRQHPTRPIDEAAMMLMQLPDDDYVERYQQARKCISQLGDMQRDVLLLKYEEDLSYQQIAQRLHITTDHVGVLLHRALQTLKRELLNSHNINDTHSS